MQHLDPHWLITWSEVYVTLSYSFNIHARGADVLLSIGVKDRLKYFVYDLNDILWLIKALF